MGNPSNSSKTRLKNQAPKVQISLNAPAPAGGGTHVSEPETVEIHLIKLDPAVVAEAHPGDSVQIKTESGSYEVYLHDQRLGTVPGSYDSVLRPKEEYRGKITRVSLGTLPSVTIEVRLPRTKS